MEPGENTEKMCGFIIGVQLHEKPLVYSEGDSTMEVFATAQDTEDLSLNFPKIYVRTSKKEHPPEVEGTTIGNTTQSINVIGVVGEMVYYEKDISLKLPLWSGLRTAVAKRRATKVVKSHITPLIK